MNFPNLAEFHDTAPLRGWKNLWSKWRSKKLVPQVGASTCEVQKCELLGGSRGMPPGKSLKSGPLSLHFQHSEAKFRVFEQSTDIFKFWLLGGNFQRKVGGKFK